MYKICHCSAIQNVSLLRLIGTLIDPSLSTHTVPEVQQNCVPGRRVV